MGISCTSNPNLNSRVDPRENLQAGIVIAQAEQMTAVTQQDVFAKFDEELDYRRDFASAQAHETAHFPSAPTSPLGKIIRKLFLD